METWRTPGELLGRDSEYTSGRGTYVWNNKIYSSVVGVERVSQPPPFPQDKVILKLSTVIKSTFLSFLTLFPLSLQRLVIEVIGEKQHGAVPEPGLVITGKDSPSLRARFSPLDSISDTWTEDIVVYQLMFAIEALLESIRVPVQNIEEMIEQSEDCMGRLVWSQDQFSTAEQIQYLVFLELMIQRGCHGECGGDCFTVGKVMAKSALVDIVCVGSRAVKEKFSGILRQQDVRATEIDKVEMYNCFRPGDIIKAEVLSLGDARSYVLTTAKNELGVVYATSVAGAKMVPVSWQEMMCPLTNQKEPRKVAKVV
ncbi:hypothetical protein L7F22_030373 [Adiantum nelumboides]|nr:hypothetical protein [Adiantum nelumboides]